MKPGLHHLAVRAWLEAEQTYKDAIAARAAIDKVLDSIAVDDKDLYLRTVRIQDTFVQAINAAWNAKYAAEQLKDDLARTILAQEEMITSRLGEIGAEDAEKWHAENTPKPKPPLGEIRKLD